MCGIAGAVGRNKKIDHHLLKRMTDSVAHRGPDGEGFWIDSKEQVGLGHRRLAIIDLSDAGRQPMAYSNGRYHLTFNGEIYNYVELRADLEARGHRFVSTSDTEVLLALFSEKKEKCLDELDGMFAFAIWDDKERRLFAARDRFGEKPFYYGLHEGTFYFGSEMKALWAAGVPRVTADAMIYNYLAEGFMYDPRDLSRTFFDGISKLKAAHYFYISPDDLEAKQIRYWTLEEQVLDQEIPEVDAEERFRELFTESVKRRLRSDVPVGSSLSGGLDSSLVVCTIDRLNKETSVRQATFSARFPGFAKDEGEYMQAVIDRTNVEPHFVFPDEEGLIENIEKLFHHQEEPFGSASIYAQYCVMRLAKEHGVIVLLDGQGADELLAGYHPYFDDYLDELRRGRPQAWRAERKAHAALYGGRKGNFDLKKAVAKSLPGPLRFTAKRLYRRWNRVSSSFLSEDFRQANANDSFGFPDKPGSLRESLRRHAEGGALEELLRYADRNSMAHSREVRLPFLSHHLAEFLFSLPSDLKIRNGVHKYIMRRAFRDVLPEKILGRTDKIGYEPPQRSWLSDPRMTEKVKDAAATLISAGILSRKAEDLIGSADGERTIFDSRRWKTLMAARLLDL